MSILVTSRSGRSDFFDNNNPVVVAGAIQMQGSLFECTPGLVLKGDQKGNLACLGGATQYQ